jgi:RHS repeat-associated protein
LNDPLNITGYSQVLKQTETDLETGEQANITYIIGRNRISQITLKDNTEQELYFTFDGHGSTRVLTDLAGAIVELYAFDAYGNAIGFDPSVALTEFLYSGEQFDSKIGQQYLRARYYDPATGRFNRLDPFFGNLTDPQSLHKYLYVHVDPINGTDPSGESLMSVGISMASGMVRSIGSTIVAFGVQRLAYWTAASVVLNGILGACFTRWIASADPNIPPEALNAYTFWGALSSAILGAIFPIGIVVAPTLTTIGGISLLGMGSFEALKSYWMGNSTKGNRILAAMVVSIFANSALGYGFLPRSPGIDVVPTRPAWGEFLRSDFVRVLCEYGKTNKAFRNQELTEITIDSVPDVAISGGKTIGVMSCRDGEIPLISGTKDAVYAQMPQNTGPGMTNVTKTHVEMKTAWLMKNEGIPKADLFLNRAPCTYEINSGNLGGCDVFIPRTLPAGYTLTVYYPGGTKVYIGTGGQ